MVSSSLLHRSVAWNEKELANSPDCFPHKSTVHSQLQSAFDLPSTSSLFFYHHVFLPPRQLPSPRQPPPHCDSSHHSQRSWSIRPRCRKGKEQPSTSELLRPPCWNARRQGCPTHGRTGRRQRCPTHGRTGSSTCRPTSSTTSCPTRRCPNRPPCLPPRVCSNEFARTHWCRQGRPPRPTGWTMLIISQ